jgi:uncharacterized membrane protein YagU involved in acid resistance
VLGRGWRIAALVVPTVVALLVAVEIGRSAESHTVAYTTLITLAATATIGAAALINIVSPILILDFIAGGLLGKTALAGGASVAFLGLVLQWAMSLIIAAIYVVAARWLPIIKRLWIVGALAYGAVIFFVMNYVVVPLSAWAKWPNFTAEKFAENMLAMLLFGLIVAFFRSPFGLKVAAAQTRRRNDCLQFLPALSLRRLRWSRLTSGEEQGQERSPNTALPRSTRPSWVPAGLQPIEWRQV